MSDCRRSQRAPAGLGSAGRALWRRLTEGLRLRSDELVLLEAAARTADELAELEAALAEAPATVAGSMGQTRPNPLYAEVRAHREALRRLLGSLDVPEAECVGSEWDGLSRAGRRTIPLGPRALAALEEQYAATRYEAPECVVFGHAALGTPLDPSKLTGYARQAYSRAALGKPVRPWHGLRHTALTETAAAGVPAMYVQAKAGHAQGSTTELAEARLF